MPIRAVIFDLDGTLADTLPVCFEAFRTALRTHAGRIYSNEEIRCHFGPSEEGMLQTIVPDVWERCFDDYLREYERAHVLCPRPFPGIGDALNLLRARGVSRALVTGKGAKSTAITLRLLGVADAFDAIETGSASGAVKPDAIRKVLGDLGLASADAAYVGDVPYDVDAAREAGVLPLAAAWAPGTDAHALAAREPAHLFRTVEDFIRWLVEEGGRRCEA
jgi:pyrophosphatase PpaX